MTQPHSDTSDREIRVSRHINAPARRVFRAWTDPLHLGRWFGPDGFSVTTHEFAFGEGGVWAFTMHGPDGTDYPNWIRWEEIVRDRSIRYVQGAGPDDPGSFQTTVTFREEGGGTLITLHSVFGTREQRDLVVERFGALEGAHQTLGRLAEQVEGTGDSAAGGSPGLSPGAAGGKVFFSVTLSLDGFLAPDWRSDRQWMEQWMKLQDWVLHQEFFRGNLKFGEGGETGADNRVLEETFRRTGATILGKRMFDKGEHSWPEEAPFHTPVFVLTGQRRGPWVRPGGTTFHFVNDGIESALRQAREAATPRDVRIGGGARTIQQFLDAGLVDEFHIALAPVLLGEGERLFRRIEPSRMRLEVLPGEPSERVTHLRYRVIRE